MSYSKSILILILLATIISCNKQTSSEGVKLSKLDSEKNWKIKIEDTVSIDVQTISPHLSDYDSINQRYIMYDAGLKKFFEFDEAWNLMKEIDLSGDSPNAYGPQCFGFTIFQDSLLAISGLKGVFIYDDEYKLIEKFTRPENVFPNVQSNWQIFDWSQNGEMEIISPYVLESEDLKLHDQEPFAFLSFKYGKDEFGSDFFGVLDKESIYLNSSENLPINKPQLAVNKEKKHIYRVNQLEPVVYVYDNDGDLEKLIDIQQGNFGNPSSVDPNLKGMERINAERSNDRFISLNASSGLLAASFFKGASKEDQQGLPKRYLSFIKDEKLLLNEIELRDPLIALFKILPDGHLLFKGKPPVKHGKETEGFGTTFYVGSLIQEDDPL